MFQDYIINSYQVVLSLDCGPNPRPLTYYIESRNEIWNTEIEITEKKGSAVIRMWSNAITEAIFHGGVKMYLKEK